MTAGLLDARGLTVRFGGLVALSELDLRVEPGEIRGLIGPNGAGKSTFLNVLTGLCRPAAGELRFNGRDMRRKRSYHLAKLGLARTFQNIRLFADMPVIHNVMVAGHCRMPRGVVGTLLGFGRREEATMRAEAERLLAAVGLEHRAWDLAGDLPYGQQRMLEIARALATQPKLLLLDEPAAGLPHSEAQELMRRLRGLRDTGITILLIEHNMQLVMNLCERITVLDFGRKIAEGTPAEVQADANVIEAYLGKGEDDALL